MDPDNLGGQASEAAPTTESEVESEQQAALTTDTGDAAGAGQGVDDNQPRYTVKVDGEELEVGIDELLNGYSRQADYTKKSQQLAAEREELATVRAIQTALEKDPKATLEALSQVYGITAEADPVDEDLDPIEARLAAQERRWEEQERQQRQREVIASAEKAISDTKIEGATAEDLLSFAVENEIGNLNAAARLYKAEKVKEAKMDAKVEQKRNLPPVESGKGRAPEGVQAAKPKNLREAWKLAKKQHGVEDAAALLK